MRLHVGTITPGKSAVPIGPELMPTLPLNTLLGLLPRIKNKHAHQKTHKRMSTESYFG